MSDQSKTQYSKLIMCNIHGPIRVDPLALKIINTPEFQRMREIKQLGLCHFIYPTATHTRFEHSIGTYYLAGKMLEKIKQNYPDRNFIIPDIGPTKLTDKIMQCIKIAALCHDIGHGPFSHSFDNSLLKNITHPNKHHEVRSCLITEMLCKRELKNELDDQDINFIKTIIFPTEIHTSTLYQIVSNKKTEIDVDKFDYLLRDTKNLNMCTNFCFDRLISEFIIDSNDNLVYPKHCSMDIYELFHTRYMMHKKIYSHKTVKIIETMLNDIFVKIDPIFELSKTIYDMTLFCQLTDSSIFSYLKLIASPPPFVEMKLSNEEMSVLMDAYRIYLRIINRKFYKQIAEIISKDTDVGHKLGELVSNLTKKYPNMNCNDFQIIKTKIGFINNSKKNPFDYIFFYDKKENINIFGANKTRISNLITNNFNETIWSLIYKNNESICQIIDDVELYLRKI